MFKAGFRSLFIIFYLVFNSSYAVQTYDPGPNPKTPWGKSYIELINNIPNFVYIGRSLNDGKDKFRFPFGTMPSRGPVEPDSVQVLVIGQDGTHIAEAAGRPFTGGTGGRLQAFLAYLGIRDSAFFMNTFSLTINGQYADYAPLIVNGVPKTTQFLPPEAYMLGQDLNNPMVQWRNDYIEWVLKNNKNSLKLIICVGGAAKDTLATFITSRGGAVPTFYDEKSVQKVQTVLYGSEHAELNRSVFFPIDEAGNNVLLNENEKPNYKDKKWVAEMESRMKDRMGKMIKLTSGPYKNGILNLAQLGYNLEKFSTDGKDNSLEGLKLSDGTILKGVRFLNVRHPGSMSPALEADFQSKANQTLDFEKEGWTALKPDKDQVNGLKVNQKFDYNAKPSIPEKDFPLGKSSALIVNNSLAMRDGKFTIIYGGRQHVDFDKSEWEKILNALPSEGVDHFIGTQPWNPPETSDEFDRGPGEEWAKLFKQVPLDLPVSSHKVHKSFGYYRGNLESPEILIIADPSSRDLEDGYTSVALSGELGQRLQGFLSGLGVTEKYAIIKTLPFDMTDATDENWSKAIEKSNEWRKKVLSKALKAEPKIILTLGRYADEQLEQLGLSSEIDVPVISLTEGFKEGFDKIKKTNIFKDSKYSEESLSIPRRHLPYPMQAWVGTSGTRAMRALGENGGVYYNIIAPKWVATVANKNQTSRNSETEQKYVDAQNKLLQEQGFALDGKSMQVIPVTEPVKIRGKTKLNICVGLFAANG